MKKFANLYIELVQESQLKRRVDTLANYFLAISGKDGAIALSIMMGFKNKSVIKREVLAQLACESALIPLWMFEECLTHGNNYLDTVSVILPRISNTYHFSLQESMSWLESLSKLDTDEVKQRIVCRWSIMDVEERIVINQMLCGVFKFEVSFDELAAALALCLGQDKGVIGIRLSKWKSMISSLHDFRMPIDEMVEFALPEVFQTRCDWSDDLVELEGPLTYCAKRVLDGIDVQVVKLNGDVFIWGKDKRLFWKRFPELEAYFLSFEDEFILHGTLVGWGSNGIDKVVLQKRESKKSITSKIMVDFPVRFIVSDLRKRILNSQEVEPASQEVLDRFLKKIDNVNSPILWNEEIVFNSWAELFATQYNQKLRGSLGMDIYPIPVKEVGFDQRKHYFKKDEPHSLNLILLYVKFGSFSGDKSGEEYTFGIRHESSYMPIARVSCIQDDNERTFIREFVKINTLEKFGPVRNVKPVLVFKISFASIYLNERRKSGVELVNSKIICRLTQLTVDDAHLLSDVLSFL